MTAQTQIRHLTFETSFGVCAVIFREKPFLAVALLLPAPNKNSLASRVDKKMWGEAGSHPKAAEMARAIQGYFMGNLPEKRWPFWDWLDFGRLTALEKKVLFAASQIPYGETRSYREIAESVGKPHAYRFVGSTMAKNPFPILIPCHRVVRSDRSVGQFGGGPEMKRKMIELERPSISQHTTCKRK